MRRRPVRRGMLLGSLALVLLLALGGVTATAQARSSHPAFPAYLARPLAPLHALPVKYDPAQNAVLRTPPTQVQITFNEQVNPDISKIVVVNPSNQEVDNRDTQFSADGYTMTVSLPFLPAGTYVVFWRTHSAQDGHVAGGSYIFHIARADGTVPPLTGKLPSGNIIGGAGLAPTDVLNGPIVLGAIARWIALLALTLLLGMLFWMLVVQPRQPALSESFTDDLRRRYRRVAQIALVVVLAATLLEIAAQALLLDGAPSAIVSLPLLKSILLQSLFGRAIFVRLVFTVLGLLVLWLPPEWRPLLDRWAEVIALAGFGLGLALAFEYSGHGGSAPTWWGPIIDFLHLVANGIWLGGLFTLALVIAPALWHRERQEQQAYLMRSVPAFSVPALVAVAFVTVTGPLNATVRLTSVQQVWTTPYGLVLMLKSLLFLAMVAISYHHAFRLRPRLAGIAGGIFRRHDADGGGIPFLRGLASHLQLYSLLAEPTPEGALALSPGHVEAQAGGASQSSPGTGDTARLAMTILRWMRTEAVIGAAVLLCAAMLGPLAGTLIPPVTQAASFGATGGTQTITHQVDGLTVTLNVNPGRFGTNTFTVVVTNPNGAPASDGSVFLVATMVEMDMGANTISLVPSSAPGTYTGQGEISMAGHWNLQAVIRTREDPNHLHQVTFLISASY